MRNLSVTVVLVCLMALAQAGHSADLHAGWYARMYSVAYNSVDTQGIPVLVGDPSFLTSPGVYEPFTLSDGPYYWRYSRQVDVPIDASGVDASNSLLLPLSAALDPATKLTYIDFMWETNYDPTQMRLEFWHDRGSGDYGLLWTQPLSGSLSGSAQVAYDVTVDNGFFFKVVVVPELPSLASLLGFVSAAACWLKMRRR